MCCSPCRLCVAAARADFLKRHPQELALQLTILAMERLLDLRSPRDFLSKVPNKSGVSQIKLSNQMRSNSTNDAHAD
jgi:hypothetical protein